jgi:hypothetical protein
MKIMNFHHPLIILMPVPQSPAAETLRGGRLPQKQKNIITALLDAFLRDHQAKKTYAH